MLFKESRTGLHFQTNKRMTQTPEMISGVFLGTIFIVITFKKELNSTCRKKGPSPEIMKILLLRRGSIHGVITTLCTNLFLHPKQ